MRMACGLPASKTFSLRLSSGDRSIAGIQVKRGNPSARSGFAGRGVVGIERIEKDELRIALFEFDEI